MYVPCVSLQGGERWEGYTLILAAVSVGNVGQLAVDLLISTIVAKRVGYIYDESLQPAVGNNPYYTGQAGQTCTLATACDVYCSDENKVVLIQQRAPFVKGKRGGFRERLLQWVTEKKFGLTVVLGSTFAHSRLDRQLAEGTLLRYLATDAVSAKTVTSLKEKLGMKELEPRPGPDDLPPELRIPGGGICKTLYEQSQSKRIPLVVLLTFSSEGDNSPDAMQLASALKELHPLRGVVNQLTGSRPTKTQPRR